MPEENEVSLYDYIKVISKWKWLIIIGTFVCILTAGIVTLLLPKVYETRATLAMQGSVTPDVKIDVLTVPTGLSLDEFFSLLSSDRDLNLEVIENLELDKSPDELTPQSLGQTLTFNLSKDSKTITINVQYSHSQKTKDIADTMAEVVKEHYQILNEAEIAQSQALIDEQLNLAQARLTEAENNFQALKETVDVDFLRKEMQTRVSQETNLMQEYSRILMSLVGQEARLDKAQEELQKQDRFYVLSKSIVEDLPYIGLLDKLTKDDIALLQKVKSESQQINTVYLNLEQTVVNARISIAASEAKESLLREKIEENKLALNKLQILLAEKGVEWETLTENYNLTNKEYQSIHNTHREAEKLLAAAEARQLKMVSTAGVPSSPIEPKTKRILLISAVIGLLAALFLAFFLEYLAKMKRLETESKKQKN